MQSNKSQRQSKQINEDKSNLERGKEVMVGQFGG